jgi:hypothetical protein
MIVGVGGYGFSDYLHMAVSCRAFMDLALDVLWADGQSLGQFVALFPEGMVSFAEPKYRVSYLRVVRTTIAQVSTVCTASCRRRMGQVRVLRKARALSEHLLLGHVYDGEYTSNVEHASSTRMAVSKTAEHIMGHSR